MRDLNDRLEKLSLATVSLLSQIDGLNGQWIGGTQLSPQLLGRLKRSVLVTSTGASTRIEGSKLSDEEVEQLMRGLSTQKLADRDAQEVRGYFEILATVFDSWQDIQLTESTIKHLHSELLKYSEKDQHQRGNYKSLDNKVVATDSAGNHVGTIFETTPPYLTAKEMNELVAWTQQAIAGKTYHPLLVIANFVIEFLKIHPFLDGNGRLSRVLTNLLMLQAGYGFVPYVSHEKLVEDNKSDYYIALRRSQATFGTSDESVAAWVQFFLQIALMQATQAIALLSSETIEKLLSPNQLLVWQYVQGAAGEVGVAEIAQSTGVAHATVRQAVDRLLTHNKIERIGQGRTTRYRVK